MDANSQPVLPAVSPCVTFVCMDQAWAVESDGSEFNSWVKLGQPSDLDQTA